MENKMESDENEEKCCLIILELKFGRVFPSSVLSRLIFLRGRFAAPSSAIKSKEPAFRDYIIT